MDRNYLPPAAEWWSFMPGILYLVGTPIGNLGDMSKRTAEILGSTDFIAAEDTRVSIKLLNHLGIKKHMISYFEHNKRERGEEIAARIEAGENCALVTDAGMPLFQTQVKISSPFVHSVALRLVLSQGLVLQYVHLQFQDFLQADFALRAFFL